MTDTRDAGPFEQVLTVTIAGDVLSRAEARAARKLSGEVKIKGFRPGKAPRQVVEKVVGSETLRREAIDEALPTVVADAITDAGLEPAVAPRVRDIRDTDEGVEVDVLVTMWPEPASLPDYRGREIEIDRPDLEEGEVQERIDRVRDQFAELDDVDREAVDGDYVLIDIARAGGDDIVNDMLYEVGSGRLLDGLDIPLRGSKAGSIEEFDTTLPVPDGEPEEAVARVLVKQVKAKRLPELTDEWVAEVSEFETVAEMREQLAEDLAAMKASSARMVLAERLVEDLIADLDVELPEALVDAEMEAVFHNFAHQLSQRGVSIEQYLQLSGQDQDAFIADLRERSSRNLKTRLLLDGVAAAEGLEVADDEVTAAVLQLAAAAGVSVEDYREALEEGGREQALAGDILREKARTRLVELAVPVDADGDVIELPEPERADPPDAGAGDEESDGGAGTATDDEDEQ
ncbi:MAG: trigger factor [Actinobacteria bacterium]|nr:trigger factor [Actinomycetota bacterium]